MNRRWVLSSAAAITAAIGAVALRWRMPGADQPVTIKFSHVVARDTPKGKAADYFKRIVEQRSGGRVQVLVYPNSELYRDQEELEALQLGSVQMVAPSLAKLAPLGIQEFELFDLPFLFDSYAALRKVTNGPVGRQMLERLGNAGMLGLAFWDNGFKLMSANRPLLAPDDFRGLHMRIQASAVLDAQMRALGAIPDATAVSDMYPALASGVADGTENPASNFYTQKIYQVQRYLTLSNHGYLGYVVMVNKTFWASLPGHVRTLLEDCMREATHYEQDIAKSENDAALEQIRATGQTQILELTPEQRAQWKAALAGVRTGFQKRQGALLLQEVEQAVNGPTVAGY
ncbi:TRAP transporter substrate-binding protein [Xylophilus sp. GW821-FHT01B05]